MSSGLVLILLVAGGYLAARIAVKVLARRYLIVAGAEYLLLGILLGPQVSGFIRSNIVDSYGPFITLAIGWMGAVIGSELYIPALLRVRGSTYQTAFLEALLTGAVVSAVMLGTLVWIAGVTPEQALTPAIVLGAIAVSTSSSGIALAARRVTREGRRLPLLRQLQTAAGMDAVVAMTVFALLLCLVHPAPPTGARAPTPTEWAVLSVGIGVVGGILYHLFLGSERQPDRLFIALTAAITLASGTAAYARLTPLLPTLLIGAILANTSHNRAAIVDVLHRVQRPLYFVLLIFAGAAWRPAQGPWVVPILLFLLVRVAAKIGAARLAARMSGTARELGPDWGQALIGQGSLALAIALNYRLFDSSPLPNLVFTTAIVSVLLTDLISARLVRAAVRRHHSRGAIEAG